MEFSYANNTDGRVLAETWALSLIPNVLTCCMQSVSEINLGYLLKSHKATLVLMLILLIK